MRALLVFEKKIVREVLTFFAEGRYLMEVVEAESADRAIEILEKENNAFDLVICDYDTTGLRTVQHVFSAGEQLHFLCVTASPPSGEFFVKQKNWIHFLDPKNLFTGLNAAVKQLFNQSIRDERPPELQFARIRCAMLLLASPLPGDIYATLGPGKFLRMSKENELFDKTDLQYFHERRKIGHLYVRSADVSAFTARLHGVITGELKVTQPAGRQDRTRLYEQAFEKPDLTRLGPPPGPPAVRETAEQLEAKRRQMAEKKAALDKATAELRAKRNDDVRKSRVEALSRDFANELGESLELVLAMTDQLGFAPEAQAIARANMVRTISLIKTSATLSVILDGLRRERERYIPSHSMLLAHIACALASRLEWSNELTYQKLTLAAFLHDITLRNHELARLHTLAEVSKSELRFSDQEVQDFKDHPQLAAELTLKMKEIPPDVDIIIAQHHEKPDGKGFPRGITQQRISPLSAVFIVAHDIVRYLMAKDPAAGFEPRDLDEWIARFGPFYDVGNFRKVIAAAQRINK